MCGIVGVRRSWRGAGGFDAALAALAWRGPDARRALQAGDWQLGVARLAISDPAADPPLVCPRTGRIVLFNGAVTSAAAERSLSGPPPRTGNDAELLLRRLERDGAAALAGICGPYAFAILDPAEDSLWLGRDPCGEKPLFVAIAAGRPVAFASSLPALRLLGVATELEPAEQARFLRFGFVLHHAGRGDAALLDDLRGVLASERGGPLLPLPPAPRTGSPDRALRARIVAAVARCASAEVPVALSLSGGVDSACLAIAAAECGLSLPAYQFRAIGEPAAERNQALAVAAATGHLLRPVDGGPELLQALPALTQAAGAPLGDPSVLAVHAVARAAAQDRIRVLLSGEGADDLWLGYRRTRAARWLPRRGLRFLPRPRLSMRPGARLWRALASAVPYDELLAVAPPAFLRAAVALPPAGLPPQPAALGTLACARARERGIYLRHDLLPKLDVATMAAGIEGRCPFLDPEVLQAPESTTLGPRAVLGKRPLRRGFASELPPVVRAARKRGFAIPLDRWLREDSFLPDLLRDLRRAPVDRAGVGRMLDLHRRGRARLGHALYLVAALELHLRDQEIRSGCASSAS